MAVPKAGVFAEGEGYCCCKKYHFKNSIKKDSELFDGKGGCFIESGRDTASVIEVDMFTNEKPSTKLF